tara:strand:- start:77 stop:583 length:507 start_codon:yes stop_codon:yes gene_type:complete
MASAKVSTLKGYFDTGDRPTAANFADLIETINYPYHNGFSAQTADFTAAAGYVYGCTLLSGCDVTLPTPVVGDVIKIVFGAVTSGTHSITTDATTTLFNGYALLGDTLDGTAAQHVVFAPDGSDDDVFSMNGTTTGVSAIVELTATATNRWFAEATVLASGAVSTPWA